MNRKSLYWKLTLAFIGVAFSATAMAAIFVRVSTNDSLAQFIIDQQRSSMIQSLSNYFTEHGSWDGVENSWEDMQRQTIPTPNPSDPTKEPGPEPDKPFTDRFRRNLFGLADPNGVVIVSVDQDFPVGSHLSPDKYSSSSVIEVGGKTVGTVLTARHISRFSPEEALFLERTNQALLARFLPVYGGSCDRHHPGEYFNPSASGPNSRRTKYSRRPTRTGSKGNSKDEIGQLAEAFNQMSREVARVNASARAR